MTEVQYIEVDEATARKIGIIELNKSRKQIAILLSTSYDAVNVECGDIVTLTYEDFGINNKKFKVNKLKFSPKKMKIDFTLVEYSEEFYQANNLSVNDSRDDFTVADLTQFPKVITESPTFAGNKDNLNIVDNKLTITDTSIEGVYEFSNSFDLGDILPIRLESTLSLRIYDSSQDDILIITDVLTEQDIISLGNNDKGTVTIYYQYSEDNTHYSEWDKFLHNSIIFSRYIKFKVVLQSLDTDTNIEISELSIKAKLNF